MQHGMTIAYRKYIYAKVRPKKNKINIYSIGTMA
jgi:hypothetical protein